MGGFFHLRMDDQRPMFERFAAHARPGAPLMFTSGPAHGEAIGSFCGEPLYHGSLDPADYEGLLRKPGFRCSRMFPKTPAAASIRCGSQGTEAVSKRVRTEIGRASCRGR